MARSGAGPAPRPRVQAAWKRAGFGVREPERDCGVRPAGRRCSRKNGKSGPQVALAALSRPPVQAVLGMQIMNWDSYTMISKFGM
jgi:hypothetical protein